jgi:hypothetical protein
MKEGSVRMSSMKEELQKTEKRIEKNHKAQKEYCERICDEIIKFQRT